MGVAVAVCVGVGVRVGVGVLVAVGVGVGVSVTVGTTGSTYLGVVKLVHLPHCVRAESAHRCPRALYQPLATLLKYAGDELSFAVR